MVDWIIKNKEWLFSGAGIALIGFVVGMIRILRRRKIRKKPSQENMEIPFSDEGYLLKPLPSEIKDLIESAPPLAQDSRASEYTGIKVRWNTSLSSAKLQDDGTLHLMLLDRGNYPWIYCNVSRAEYPELMITRKGTTIWIAGTIAEYRSNTFTLEEVRLKIIGSESGRD